MKKIREMKIYPHPSFFSGNLSLLIKEKKGAQWGNSCLHSGCSLQLVELKKIKKRAQWKNLLNLFFSWVIFGKKLIQPSHNLIYQPSVKSWQNISSYQELY